MAGIGFGVTYLKGQDIQRKSDCCLRIFQEFSSRSFARLTQIRPAARACWQRNLSPGTLAIKAGSCYDWRMSSEESQRIFSFHILFLILRILVVAGVIALLVYRYDRNEPGTIIQQAQ